jgi:hypothetical protein
MGIFDDIGRIMDASKDAPRVGLSDGLKQAADHAEQAKVYREQAAAAAAGLGGAPSFNPFVNAAAMNSAVAGTGTVKALTDSGQKFETTTIYDVTLEVTLDGEEPFEVVHRQMIAAAAIGNWQPGKTIPVRVDPTDKTKVMLG